MIPHSGGDDNGVCSGRGGSGDRFAFPSRFCPLAPFHGVASISLISCPACLFRFEYGGGGGAATIVPIHDRFALLDLSPFKSPPQPGSLLLPAISFRLSKSERGSEVVFLHQSG